MLVYKILQAVSKKKINTSKHYANFSKIFLVNPYPFPKWIISKDIRPKEDM